MSNPSLNIDVKIQELIPYVMELSDKKDTALGRALVDLIGQLVTTTPKRSKSICHQRGRTLLTWKK
jgi:hypothetical protein